jgi:hypothetical protein
MTKNAHQTWKMCEQQARLWKLKFLQRQQQQEQQQRPDDDRNNSTERFLFDWNL